MPQSNPPLPPKVRVTRISPVIILDQRRFDAALALLIGMGETILDAAHTDQAQPHPTTEPAASLEQAAK